MTEPIEHTPARFEAEFLDDPRRCRVIIVDPDGSRRWAWLDAEQAVAHGSALLRWGKGFTPS